MTTLACPITPPVPFERVHPISLDLYTAMVETGMLSPRDRVVLIEGMLVDKMPRGDRHVGVVRRGVTVLRRLNLPGFWVLKEDPIALPGVRPGDRDSVPEPDIVLARGDEDDYAHKKPCPPTSSSWSRSPKVRSSRTAGRSASSPDRESRSSGS